MQFKSGSKPLGIYPFVSKLIFAKIPQTIEKSEQFRCHLNHSLLLAAGLGYLRYASCVLAVNRSDFETKNSPQDYFFNVSHPLRVRILPVFTRKKAHQMMCFILGCRTRIRTQTNRVRVCCATFTQSGNLFGGEEGIRTLETLLTFTAFPMLRLQPTQPPLHKKLSQS